MNAFLKALTLAAALGAGTAHAAAEPTFVLVHGALFTEGGWAPLKAELAARGARAVTLNVPGRAEDGVDPRTIDIKAAAAKVCEVVDGIYGPKILVGHSQGGAVITQAFGDCGEEVTGLVFVAAVAPLSGETAFQGLNPERDTNFNLCVMVDAEAGLFRLNPNGPLESSFFQDLRAVSPELADQALASMVSEPIGIGTTPLSFDMDRYDRVAKYYVLATEDQVVSPETQRAFVERTAFAKVYEIAAGHSPFLSQVAATADALLDARRLVHFSDASFDEIILEQANLSPAAAVEIHYVKNQRYDITLVVGDEAYVVPVTNRWTDWCNVSFTHGYDVPSGLTIEVVDHSVSQCSHTDRDRSEVTLEQAGVRRGFSGPGLVAHIPGF